MKISDIDKNLAVESATGLSPIVWLDVKEEPFRIHGLAVTEKGSPFLRMPYEIAASVSEGVMWLNNHTAGGRIRFRTDSPWIAMRAVMPDREHTAITLASMSIAMPQVAWEIASMMFPILNSRSRNSCA